MRGENIKGSKELVFVYNAKSDVFNKVVDFTHKLLSPQTYSCSLCRLTHGNMGMHTKWAEFLQKLPHKTTFLYKDQVTELSIDEELPLVLLRGANSTEVLLTAPELNSVGSIDELIEVIVAKL